MYQTGILVGMYQLLGGLLGELFLGFCWDEGADAFFELFAARAEGEDLAGDLFSIILGHLFYEIELLLEGFFCCLLLADFQAVREGGGLSSISQLTGELLA